MANTPIPAEERDWLDSVSDYFKTHPKIILPAVIVIVLIAYFAGQHFFTTQPIGTDPTVAGRPLSNPAQHLHSFAIDPLQPGVIILGSHYGVFASSNNGASWPQNRGLLDTLMITYLSPSITDTKTIGMVGISPSGINFNGSNGLYVSHNEGASWTHMADPAGVSPDTSRYLIYSVPTASNTWMAIYVGLGLYVTTDDGHIWSLLKAPVSHQESQRVVWVSQSNPQLILLGSTVGLYRSIDGGKTWQTDSQINSGVSVIRSVPTHPDTVYISSDAGIYRSDDGGKTFELVSTNVTNAAFSQLAVGYQNANILYGLVGQQIWSSTDGGKVWNQTSQLNTSYPMGLYVSPQNDQQIYVGFYTPAEVIESTDGGKNWHLVAS